MINAYIETRMDALQDSVKAWVSETFDAPADGAWRNGWEFYAFMKCKDEALLTGMIERDILDPAVIGRVGTLGEIELTALLSWVWNEYAEDHETGESLPWKMDSPSRRRALASVLARHMQAEAQSDGAEIEDRQFAEDWGERENAGDPDTDALEE